MMNLPSFTRSAVLTSGILSLFAVGCGGGGSAQDTVSEAPLESGSEDMAVINPQVIANRLDNLEITIEGEEAYYHEFALPQNEMSDWDLDGWNVVEETLQNDHSSSMEVPMEVALLDKNENIVMIETFSGCDRESHSHEVKFKHSVTPSAVLFTIGNNVARLHLDAHQSKGYLHFLLTFDCSLQEYVEPKQYIEFLPGLADPSFLGKNEVLLGSYKDANPQAEKKQTLSLK